MKISYNKTMDRYELDLYTDYLMVTFGYATMLIKSIRWRHKSRYVYKVLIKCLKISNNLNHFA